MTSLRDFIAARLNEDEAAAKAALDAQAAGVPPEGSSLLRFRDAAPGTASVEDVLYYVWCAALDAKAMMHEPHPATEEDYRRKQRNVLDRARVAVSLTDPVRAMRHVELGRDLLEEHHIGSAGRNRSETGCSGCEVYLGRDDAWHFNSSAEGCETLQSLATVWSDHPDFREEWAQ